MYIFILFNDRIVNRDIKRYSYEKIYRTRKSCALHLSELIE